MEKERKTAVVELHFSIRV